MNKFIFTLCFSFILNSFSQDKYPQSYFQNPLDVPLYLSGTFGELRSNHFHSGLDLKTQQREGLKVFAAAQGYVSRIRVSHYGFGKALYITHPNGYTTVYAHLKKFNPAIESYLKKAQYKKESFEIQLFPSKDALTVTQGEIVAFSGSTGGFIGPHLHYEIRDGNSKPINPLLFGIKVKDTKEPRINTLMVYPVDSTSHVNQSNIPLQINFRTQNDGSLLASKISAFGKIGFGVNVYDQLNGALNKNGIYSLGLSVNGQKKYFHDVETFSFAETKHLNQLIDYKRYADLNQRIQRCFVTEHNPLSIYKNVKDRGYVLVKDQLSYNVKIVAKDLKGNTSTLLIPVLGKKDTILVFEKEKTTNYRIKAAEFNTFSKDGVSISFPKNTFYDDFYLDFKTDNGEATVHKSNVLVHKNYTLTFDVSSYSKVAKEKLFIASYNSNGYPGFLNTTKKENSFYTSTKNLGKFALLSDIKKPSLELSNFKHKQWVTNFSKISLKVTDDLSGLKTYRGEIDGDWILLEYSPKHRTLTYDFSDKKFTTAKHLLKVIAVDNVGNTNTLKATFFRKK